ncbi:MAG: ATP-binding protein [Thermoguttaceae bacterium]|nr:ATP-binding protein [Thermoguttaceae bacterium]
MLIRIKTENFKSFDRMTELDLTSSSKIKRHGDQVVKIGNVKILKSSAIYGANASGKTNLVELFAFIVTTLRRGQPTNATRLFCRANLANRRRPSFFEIQFSIGNDFFAYGFKTVLSEGVVMEEWLYKLNPSGNSSSLVFRRSARAKTQFEFGLSLNAEDQRRFEVYVDDFSDVNNSLFLYEMNRMKKIDENSSLYVFRRIYEYLTGLISIYSPNLPVASLRYYRPDSLEFLNKVFPTFDTGVESIGLRELSLDEFKRRVPDFILEDALTILRNEVSRRGAPNAEVAMRVNANFFNLTVGENGEPIVKTFQLKHNSSSDSFEFDDESDGTRRLFELFDLLMNAPDDAVFVVDELERSLHPMLTRRFLELFFERYRNKRTQLVFTTHESAIMDQNLFRRDEIWFVERNAVGASVLFPLDRFKDRFDKQISKDYLAGRYGATPCFRRYSFNTEA